MRGAGWDAAMDQQLLIVALHVKSLDAKDICEGWTNVFSMCHLLTRVKRGSLIQIVRRCLEADFLGGLQALAAPEEVERKP